MIASGLGPVIFALSRDYYGSYRPVLQLLFVLNGACALLLLQTPLPPTPAELVKEQKQTQREGLQQLNGTAAAKGAAHVKAE